MGSSSHAVIVLGLGKTLLFKSDLGHCVLLAGNLKVLPVGLVGGLDVHEGHGGSLAPAVVIIFVVTEDLHTLDSTEPGKK